MGSVTLDKYGLEIGTPQLASIGPITFGPDGILFVADNAATAIFALDLGDRTDASSGSAPVEVTDLDTKVASLLGVDRSGIRIGGLAVHPDSRAVYLSVTRGSGDAAVPVLVRVTGSELSEVELVDVPFARFLLADAPAADDERLDTQLGHTEADGDAFEYGGITLYLRRLPLRTSTITDLAWVDGTLLVAGASNEEFASTLRRVPFPFGDDVSASSLEIFHVSHGKWETASPIRTFVPFDQGTSIVASYTCTPVVHFRLADLEPGTKATGRTVAELGAMNQPLDIITYQHEGAEYLLVSNSRHPLLKIPAATIDGQAPLTTPDEPLGVPREELDHPGVSLMANLGPSQVLLMQSDEHGHLALHTYDNASL